MPTSQKPTAPELARFWFHIGMVSWGGMYVTLPRLEEELSARGWLSRQRFHETLAIATLVPGPTFLSLAGLVGFDLGGAFTSALCLFSLMAPPTIMITIALLLVTPEMLHGPLAPIVHWLTVAVIGSLLGGAWRMARWAPTGGQVWKGPLVLAVTTAAILLGVPTPLAVIGGVALSAFLLKGGRALA